MVGGQASLSKTWQPLFGTAEGAAEIKTTNAETSSDQCSDISEGFNSTCTDL